MAPTAIPIFDGHNDTLLDLHLPLRREKAPRTFFERSDRGHIDLPRAQAGGLGGGFFAIFTPTDKTKPEPAPGAEAKGDKAQSAPPPAPQVDHTYALKFTVDMAALLFRLEREAAGALKVVRQADELAHCLDNGIFAMIFHIEGAEAIDPELRALEVLYQAGLRSLGITWSRPNSFATGVPFAFPQSPDVGPGLTEAGKALVRACNELGILLDLSHLNEKGFWDVAKLSQAPLVATHSGAHALCASTRNLTDRQLDAIRDSGGVVGVNFHVGFLRADGRSDLPTSLTEIVRHVDYMVERMGIDHVALGSDFDGATMPDDLGDVAGLPKLVEALRAAGYDDAALRKIAYENWLRVLAQTWRNGEG
ncbi:MAG TPA: dipeptidase [Caldilineaceae bacterium]|nr:dipeptidase [Caldilineaceae bacterium]